MTPYTYELKSEELEEVHTSRESFMWARIQPPIVASDELFSLMLAGAEVNVHFDRLEISHFVTTSNASVFSIIYHGLTPELEAECENLTDEEIDQHPLYHPVEQKIREVRSLFDCIMSELNAIDDPHTDNWADGTTVS